MFRKAYDLIRDELSGLAAARCAEAIWANDRGSSFDGYYRTARYCAEQLEAAGASVRTVSFPADGTTAYGTLVLPRAWECRRAALHLLAPASEARRLVSYPEQPLSCVQGSLPTSAEGVQAELVVIDGGGSPRDYRGREVAGKIVLTDGYVSAVHREATRQGAVGLLSDAMATNPVVRPDPMDLPDAVLWQVMRPVGTLPAFSISPRQGKWLRALVARNADGAEPAQVHLSVDASLTEGHLEMVSALLPGREQEEIALMAHYAEPGANDNASGTGLCLEIVRTLNTLIRAGNLPRPRRGLRVWLTHEVYTLQALAVTDPRAMRRVRAALNLDMVGEDMARCGSALMYQMTPDAAPSYINHLLRDLMQHFREGFYGWGNMSSARGYFPAMETGYWGNDNFISDPSIGVPSVAFINWPDRYYHTSEDTPRNLCPQTLERLGALAGAFVYTLANAGRPEAVRLAETVVAQAPGLLERECTQQVQRVCDALAGGEADLPALLEHGLARLAYRHDREQAALQSVRGLLPAGEGEPLERRLRELTEELAQAAGITQRRYRRVLGDLARSHGLAEPQPAAATRPGRAAREAAAVIPRRLIIGPVGTDEFSQEARDLLRRAGRDGLPSRLLYWVDGRRSLLEVGRLAALEDNRPPVPPRRLLQWYEAMRLGGVLQEAAGAAAEEAV